MRIITFLSLFILFFSVSPELQAKNVKGKKITITGTIENNRAKEITFIEYGLPFNFDPNHKVNIGDDGSFKLELDAKEAMYYYFSYNRRNVLMYLIPGDDLNINFDAKQVEATVKYTGSAAELNTYLKDRFVSEQPIARQMKGMYAKEWDAYQEFLDKNKAASQQKLDAFKEGKKIKKHLEQFVKLEQANIDGLWSFFYIQYPTYHAHYAKKDPQDLLHLVDLEMMEQKVIDDPSLLGSKAYRDFLNQFLFSKCDHDFIKAQAQLTSRAEFVEKVYFKINDKMNLDWVKDYLKARVIFEQVDKNGLGNMMAAVEDYRQTDAKKEYIAAVEKAWNKWESLKPGAMAPDIVGKDVDGNEIKLSDFKGKLVYIDVWATWCGPCRKEIPFLKKAEEQLHGKDVVFLSVSTDDDKNRWKSFVEKEGLTGVQINVPGGWGSEICKTYNIGSIPRFMMIDKEGRIIETQSMRPSQGITPLIQKRLRDSETKEN